MHLSEEMRNRLHQQTHLALDWPSSHPKRSTKYGVVYSQALKIPHSCKGEREQNKLSRQADNSSMPGCPFCRRDNNRWRNLENDPEQCSLVNEAQAGNRTRFLLSSFLTQLSACPTATHMQSNIVIVSLQKSYTNKTSSDCIQSPSKLHLPH